MVKRRLSWEEDWTRAGLVAVGRADEGASRAGDRGTAAAAAAVAAVVAL